jgi:hypothetical protein
MRYKKHFADYNLGFNDYPNFNDKFSEDVLSVRTNNFKRIKLI